MGVREGKGSEWWQQQKREWKGRTEKGRFLSMKGKEGKSYMLLRL